MDNIWVTKSGKRVLVSKMEHSHILNCIKLMARKYPQHFKTLTNKDISDIVEARLTLNSIIEYTNNWNTRDRRTDFCEFWDYYPDPNE